ncbi:hypothetical protein EUGRSUZ_E01010 [Eucalyptus grandis]|uniref:Uncharacterized protein n=2 Tax=Eucalyptus grandis TaxID=71139 RepID=A0ACC3KQE9_EUCGR|nr:hypothetical protein EUGRSUZ_E01010 [Eucalyptus grandis]
MTEPRGTSQDPCQQTNKFTPSSTLPSIQNLRHEDLQFKQYRYGRCSSACKSECHKMLTCNLQFQPQ